MQENDVPGYKLVNDRKNPARTGERDCDGHGQGCERGRLAFTACRLGPYNCRSVKKLRTARDGADSRMLLSPSHSITRCIDMLKRGDRAAAEALWDSYMHRLVALARARLGGMPRRAADEEDVALSAFDSFYRRAECGQFARLTDRDDLWQILVVITERKAIDLMRREGRKSRGAGRVVAFSDIENPVPTDIVGSGANSGVLTQVIDEFRELLGRLGDDSLRSVALAKMEGYTQQADCGPAWLHRADGRAQAALDPQDLVLRE